MSANRRDFIKFVVAGAVTAGCPIDLSLVAAQTGDAPKAHAADVDGEDNRICHQVRDKGSNFFTRPPATAQLGSGERGNGGGTGYFFLTGDGRREPER
jgi:hypothetical protein